MKKVFTNEDRFMINQVKQLLDETPEWDEKTAVLPVIQPREEDDSFTISREPDGWRVNGQRIERIATMTYFEFDTTALRFQNILENFTAGLHTHIRGLCHLANDPDLERFSVRRCLLRGWQSTHHGGIEQPGKYLNGYKII